MSTNRKTQCTVLPIPDRPRTGLTHLRRQRSGHQIPADRAIAPAQGRAERPDRPCRNDVRFGSSSALRRPLPNAERGKAGGRRPEIQPLPHHGTLLADAPGVLTGRNHHTVGMGGITEIAAGAPGYSRVLPNTWPRWRGRSSSTATARRSSASAMRCRCGRPARPGRSMPWPTGGGGFEYFYGFIGGEANQWYPALYEGTTPVEPQKTPEEGYHLMEDMTDKAITWVAPAEGPRCRTSRSSCTSRPGATHAPHHVPKEWADKYKGKFDQGWDKLREETFARQKKLGRHPARTAELTPRPRRDPGLGRHAGGAQAGARAPDGSLRRLPGVHRPPYRPADRRAGEARHPRRHADLLHHRRQRRLGRRHAATARSTR